MDILHPESHTYSAFAILSARWIDEEGKLGTEWWKEQSEKKKWLLEMLQQWKSASDHLLPKFEGVDALKKHVPVTQAIQYMSHAAISALNGDHIDLKEVLQKLQHIKDRRHYNFVLPRLANPVSKLVAAISISIEHSH